ncbi:MAG: hypothetical protein H6644_14070 [Caldilineaceae bacterium]|nr:hypothetical protein [Caldilineaceae bacterium]
MRPPGDDPSAWTQSAAALAQIDAVALADGTVVPVDHSFLLDELRAEPVDPARIHTLARALLAAQQAQGAPVFTQADTAALARVLARPEFAYATVAPPPRFVQWLDRQWERVMREWGVSCPTGRSTYPWAWPAPLPSSAWRCWPRRWR